MVALVLAFLLGADDAPRFEGGHRPTPLSGVPAHDDSVSVLACTAETLKSSATCVFDGRPAAATNPRAQAAANSAFAVQLANTLCKQRVEALIAVPKERAAKAKSCAAAVQRAASPSCSLEGKEGLVDGEGRFGSSAKACYLAIAGALQSMEVPPVPAEPPPAPADQQLTAG